MAAPVAPFVPLANSTWAWLGYREEWDHETAGGGARFVFRSLGLTIYVGKKYELPKPQVFRAEWAGWAKWADNEYSFQAQDAGHPHWQFDVLDSLKGSAAARRVDELRALLTEESEEPAEFVPNAGEDVSGQLLFSQQLSRLHFASAAAWWREAPNDIHAHCPSKPAELQRWLRRTLMYLRTELQRLA